ncbi:hypothetical protein ACQKNX_22480 [Lysinibacillus sp. NPDC093712]|uniref:hypothetical protein n=1 Tax=Lysinibacillus sp. NPDC093712 TaxID=3390579 RepID=UPI003CFC160E
MGTVPSAVKWIAGILITISFITLVVMVYSPVTDSGKAASTDTQALNTELAEQKYLIYDNSEVSGSQVVGALRKFESQGKDQKLAVYVETGRNGGAGTWYYSQFNGDQVVSSTTVSLEKAVKTTDNNYINPSGRFDASIERDSNGVIRSVKFVQKK